MSISLKSDDEEDILGFVGSYSDEDGSLSSEMDYDDGDLLKFMSEDESNKKSEGSPGVSHGRADLNQENEAIGPYSSRKVSNDALSTANWKDSSSTSRKKPTTQIAGPVEESKKVQVCVGTPVGVEDPRGEEVHSNMNLLKGGAQSEANRVGHTGLQNSAICAKTDDIAKTEEASKALYMTQTNLKIALNTISQIQKQYENSTALNSRLQAFLALVMEEKDKLVDEIVNLHKKLNECRIEDAFEPKERIVPVELELEHSKTISDLKELKEEYDNLRLDYDKLHHLNQKNQWKIENYMEKEGHFQQKLEIFQKENHELIQRTKHMFEEKQSKESILRQKSEQEHGIWDIERKKLSSEILNLETYLSEKSESYNELKHQLLNFSEVQKLLKSDLRNLKKSFKAYYEKMTMELSKARKEVQTRSSPVPKAEEYCQTICDLKRKNQLLSKELRHTKLLHSTDQTSLRKEILTARKNQQKVEADFLKVQEKLKLMVKVKTGLANEISSHRAQKEQLDRKISKYVQKAKDSEKKASHLELQLKLLQQTHTKEMEANIELLNHMQNKSSSLRKRGSSSRFSDSYREEGLGYAEEDDTNNVESGENNTKNLIDAYIKEKNHQLEIISNQFAKSQEELQRLSTEKEELCSENNMLLKSLESYMGFPSSLPGEPETKSLSPDRFPAHDRIQDHSNSTMVMPLPSPILEKIKNYGAIAHEKQSLAPF